MLFVLCVLVVAVCSPQLADGSTNMKRDLEVLTEPQVPEECRKMGYCEIMPNYPTELVQKLVDQAGKSVIYQMDNLDEDVKIAQRLGGSGSDQESELCDFTWKIMILQSAKDERDEWQTVINPPGNPLQGIRTHICTFLKPMSLAYALKHSLQMFGLYMRISPYLLEQARHEPYLCPYLYNNGSCSLKNMQEGKTASCKQEFSYRTMHTVNKDGQMEQKMLKLPSGCACTVTETD